jgi:hypothetical protein
LRAKFIAFVALSPLVAEPLVQAQNSTPVIVKRVDPEYPAGFTSYITQKVGVILTVDENGEPEGIIADLGLPENVVKALSQWQFRPARKGNRAVASSIQIVISVRRDLRETIGLKRVDKSLGLSSPSFNEGRKLTPDKVAQLEKNLNRSSGADDHLKLLGYYTSHEGVANERARLKELTWLALDDPSSDYLCGDTAAPGTGARGEEEFEWLRGFWLKQLTLLQGIPTQFEAASNFLRFTDPEAVEAAALKAAEKTDSASVALGDLYATAIAGIQGVHASDGALQTGAPSAFAVKAKTALAETNNPSVLFAGLNALAERGRSLALTGHLPEGYGAFCSQILEKAKQTYPQTDVSCDFQSSGGTVHPATVKYEDRPTFPNSAKVRKVGGREFFQLIVNKEGKPEYVNLLRGSFLFYPPAHWALTQWLFEPFSLNGKPVDDASTIEVRFISGW